MISEINNNCANCGAPCDDTWGRRLYDLTPTDYGEERREYIDYFCRDCAEIFMPAEVWGDPDDDDLREGDPDCEEGPERKAN